MLGVAAWPLSSAGALGMAASPAAATGTGGHACMIDATLTGEDCALKIGTAGTLRF